MAGARGAATVAIPSDNLSAALSEKDRDQAGGMLAGTLGTCNRRICFTHSAQGVKSGATIQANVFVNGHLSVFSCGCHSNP